MAEADPAAAPVAAPVAARGLAYEAGGTRLVGPVDLDLPAGSVTVILGPNGAGKSVLLRLLHGLIEPSTGTVLCHGRPLDGAQRRRQAMVFQRPVLLRRSAAANIDFALRLHGRADPARRDALLAEVGLAEHARHPARRLSGGEQQRLALARALALGPDTLFLDEPTASLDPASTHAIETILAAARDRGVKVVLVTHDLGQARRMAGDVVFLHRGQVTEHAAAGRFFEHPASTAACDFLAGRLVLR